MDVLAVLANIPALHWWCHPWVWGNLSSWLMDLVTHCQSRQFKGQHVYQLFMSVLTNLINHYIHQHKYYLPNIQWMVISRYGSQQFLLSEETESANVTTQTEKYPLDKIVRKLWCLSQRKQKISNSFSGFKESEIKCFTVEPRLLFSWVEYLGKWVLNVLFVLKKPFWATNIDVRVPVNFMVGREGQALHWQKPPKSGRVSLVYTRHASFMTALTGVWCKLVLN